MSAHTLWPELPPLQDWQDSCTTLHMWSQVIGKIRLGLSPKINHCWGSTLYVSARGLTTSPIPYTAGHFAIDLDFIDHALRLDASNGESLSFSLEPMPVSDFYQNTMQALNRLGIQVQLFTRPVEVVEAIPFEKDDTHKSYDADTVHRYWRALLMANRVLKEFRARFTGKASPVHFFWGAFDLAATRFSGRTAPKHPGGIPNCPDRVMQDAYSHELASAGFWPGAGLGEAAFYAYAYPSPVGFSDYRVQPEAAYFHDQLSEFILPYEAVRVTANPEQTLLSFLQSTYEAAATLGNWVHACRES